MAIDAGSIYSEVRIKLDKLNGDIKEVTTAMDKMGKGVGDTTTKTSEKVTGGFNDMGVGAVMFGSILADLAQQGAESIKEFALAFDEANETISKATGASGDALAELNDVFNSVLASGVEQSTQEVAAALGELNTRFGATGAELESLTLQVANFADVTNTDMKTSVVGISQIMNKWNIDTADIGITLDKLALASEKSGLSVTALMASMTSGAAQLQAANFSFDESIALLSAFELAGVKTESVMMGMNKAIAEMGKAGIDSRVGIKAAFEEIKNAGSIVEATTIAVDKFGTRSGAELAKALRSGKVDLDAWAKSLADAGGTVDRVGTASDTVGDKIAVFTNKVKASFMGFTTGALAGFITFWEAIPGPVKLAGGLFVALAAGIAGVQAIIPLFASAWAFMNTVFMGAPLGLIIAGLAGVTAGIIALNVEMNRQDVVRIMRGYSDLSKELNITEKQLVALVRAAESVKLPVREFIELQKATKLTTDQLAGFIKMGERLGITNSDILELNKNFGLTARQIEIAAYGMKGNDFGGFKEAAKGVEVYANNLGISRDAVIAIGLAQKGTTVALREQLEASRALYALQDQAFKSELARIEYTQQLRSGKSKEAAAQASADESARQAALPETAKQNKAIDEAVQKRAKEEVKLNTQLSMGKITQAQYNENLIKLNETAIDQILDINNGYKDGAGIIDGLIARNKSLGATYSDNSDAIKRWTKDYNDLSLSEQEMALRTIEDNRKLALAGVETGSKMADAINKYYDKLRDDSANADFLTNLKTTTDTVASIISSVGGSINDALALANTKRLDQIDSQYQAELKANGLAEKSAVEKAQAEIVAAQLAGDATAETAAKTALLKAQIDAKYQKAKAKAQYDADLAEWNNKWIMSIVDTVSAVIKAGVITPFAIATGIAGAIQTGIILANKPVAPAFQTGGIVPGNSLVGDSVAIQANSREMVLTQQQQANLFDMINQGARQSGLQSGTFACTITLDKWTFKDATIEIVEQAAKNGQMTLPSKVLGK
jgi:hypothetical protein